MATKLVTDDELMDRVTGVFRRDGYQGASLARLQEATGLKRASLYYRFPNGKVDMAKAAIEAIAQRFADEIFAPLKESSSSVEERIASIGQLLSDFYGHGKLPCILDTLSIGEPPPEIEDLLAHSMNSLITALASLAQEAGFEDSEAHARATDAVVAIEGALVVGRTIKDFSAFQRAIASLPTRLTS